MKNFIYIYILIGFIGFFMLNENIYEKLILLGIVVVYPLILTVIEDEFIKNIYEKTYFLYMLILPILIISTFLVYFSHYKWVVYLSASICLFFGVLTVGYAILRIVVMSRFTLNEVIISLGLFMYFPVSILFFAHHLGLETNPINKELLPIVIIHLLYFATIIPVKMGLLGRLINKSDIVYKLYNISLIFIFMSIITYIVSLFLEGFSIYFYIGFLFVSLILYLLIISFHVLPNNRKWSIILLAITQLSIIYAMVIPLINIYVGNVYMYSSHEILTQHGITSTFVFSLGGLLSWVYIKNSPRYNISERLFSNLDKVSVSKLKNNIKKQK